jgi:hypothetical protein
MAKIGFLLFFWLGFSAVVGEAAGKRNRSSFGWFLLALMISPLLAGLLVLALGKGRPKTVYLTQAPVEVPANTGGRSMDDLHMRRPSIGSARVIPAFPTIATKRPFTKEYSSPPDLPCRLFPGASPHHILAIA